MRNVENEIKDVDGDFATVDQLAKETVGSRCPNRVGATMVQPAVPAQGELLTVYTWWNILCGIFDNCLVKGRSKWERIRGIK